MRESFGIPFSLLHSFSLHSPIEMKEILHRIAYCIYSALCIVGLLYQVSLLSESYFKYDVSNNVRLHYARKSTDEALNVCFYFYEIFLYESYENHTGNHVDIDISDVSSAGSLANDFFVNLTINDLLKYSPSINETIEECSVRMVKKDEILSYPSGKECNQHISVSKYISNYFICYRFLFPEISNGMDTVLISSDVYEAFLIQSITFIEKMFGNVNFFYNIINSRDELPLREFMSATASLRDYRSGTNIHGSNMFGVRYYQSITKNLAQPYTTMCRNYSYMNCLTECIQTGVFKNFHRYSPMSFYDRGDYKLITSKYLDSNRSRVPIYLKIVHTCKQSCPWNECESIVSITSTDEALSWKSFRIYTILQNVASIEVNNVPKMYFIDCMTFVSSCFGTWLGISFLGLNPFKFWSKSFQTGTVSPAHDQEISPESIDQKLLRMSQQLARMSQTQRHLFNLMFQGLNNQQEWIEEHDQEIAVIRRRR